MTEEAGLTAPAAAPGQAASREHKPLFESWLDSLGAGADDEPGKELRARFREEFRILYDDLLNERVSVLDADGRPMLDRRGRPKTKFARDWRKAAYEAWSSLPASLREPRTLTELADRLGLTNTATIRHWRRKDPEIETRFKNRLTSRLLEYAPDVLMALVTVASDPDYRAHSDRKLFLEMVDLYKPRAQPIAAELTGKDGDAIQVKFVDYRAGLDGSSASEG